ncbi:MAG TPA: hypothetical protein VHD56_15510 [Tepidisphaeraceae bacterium]|nr:hypothetical protein [Tepidisphaeraceae bacterium]
MFESRAQAYAATLFEKAQGGIGTLAQIDSQINELLSQRRAVQNDLTAVQAQINEEFNRLMRESDELPARVLSEISGNSGRHVDAPETARRSTFADTAV